MWCRTEEERMQFHRHNQKTFFRVATRSEIDETVAAKGGPKVKENVFTRFIYSWAKIYMQVKYQNGMAIVLRLGKPSHFLTVTCNPK